MSEAFDVVQELVENIVNDDENFFIGLFYESDGYNESIIYLGQAIWVSENDDRQYDYDLDKYEPLKDFIKERINGINKRIGELHV